MKNFLNYKDLEGKVKIFEKNVVDCFVAALLARDDLYTFTSPWRRIWIWPVVTETMVDGRAPFLLPSVTIRETWGANSVMIWCSVSKTGWPERFTLVL